MSKEEKNCLNCKIHWDREGGCDITMEEEDLTYICSKEEFNSIMENIKSKIKKHLGIPKNRVYVGLRYNGEFEVTFTMKDDKIPVIKKED